MVGVLPTTNIYIRKASDMTKPYIQDIELKGALDDNACPANISTNAPTGKICIGGFGDEQEGHHNIVLTMAIVEKPKKSTYMFPVDNMGGRWVSLSGSNSGIGSVAYTYSHGAEWATENAEESSSSDELGGSIDLAAEADAAPLGVGVKVTTTVGFHKSHSTEESKSIARTFSHDAGEAIESICNKGSLYQWESIAERMCFDEDAKCGSALNMKTQNIVCTSSDDVPVHQINWKGCESFAEGSSGDGGYGTLNADINYRCKWYDRKKITGSVSYKHQNKQTVAQCLDLCIHHSDCNSFQYSHKTHTCNLYRDEFDNLNKVETSDSYVGKVTHNQRQAKLDSDRRYNESITGLAE